MVTCQRAPSGRTAVARVLRQTRRGPRAAAMARGHSARPPGKLKVRLRIFGPLGAPGAGFSRPLSMPLMMLPARCSASQRLGNAALTEICAGLPAYTPATKGSTRRAAGSGPSRRAKKLATLSSPPVARGMNGSRKIRSFAALESNGVRARPTGDMGISSGLPLSST